MRTCDGAMVVLLAAMLVGGAVTISAAQPTGAPTARAAGDQAAVVATLKEELERLKPYLRPRVPDAPEGRMIEFSPAVP